MLASSLDFYSAVGLSDANNYPDLESGHDSGRDLIPAFPCAFYWQDQSEIPNEETEPSSSLPSPLLGTVFYTIIRAELSFHGFGRLFMLAVLGALFANGLITV